jgi:hypothetical protein
MLNRAAFSYLMSIGTGGSRVSPFWTDTGDEGKDAKPSVDSILDTQAQIVHIPSHWRRGLSPHLTG